MVAPRRGSAARRNVRTGISISPVELCAAHVRLGAHASWRRPLDPPPIDGGSWPSLAAALQELARALGTQEGALSVALLPPLAEVRPLDLPPARAEDLQVLIARNAGRYFVNARGPQVVGVSTAPRGKHGKRGEHGEHGEHAGVVAAAASARLVASIRGAARESGWSVESIAPAEAAWASAALAAWPAFARERAFVAIAHADRTDLLELEQRRLAGVRRFRGGAEDAAMIAEVVGSNTRVGMLGAPSLRSVLASTLVSHGARVSTTTGGDEDAGITAAQFADGDTGPSLKTDEAVAAERASIRRARWILGATAAALFAAAAAVQLWGVHHQLDLVRRERAALKPKIASTLVGRMTIEAAFNDLAVLAAADREAPRWSRTIAALSDALPENAHLTAIRARGDSIVVDGLADHAAPIFDALSRVPVLEGVKAAAPVRRELQDNGESLEHFVIAARLRTPERTP